jgi:RNA ligase (TIGR02306 family)
MSRKLASVQKIVSINPIPDADAIEVAKVLNWNVVVKKDEFKVGDLIIYVEPDAWLPHELAPFLSKGQEPKEYESIVGNRLRTTKLRGQLSQGLILPMFDYSIDLFEGDDVSSLLDIIKWEPPVLAQLSGMVKGAWPSAVPKTDEDRIQTFTDDQWAELSQFKYEMTEKLEGASATFGLIDGEFFVGSRNLNLKETEDNTFWKIAHRFEIEKKMRAENMFNVVIQGEIIGEGIQGNHYEVKGQHFYVFSMFNIETGEYLSPELRTTLTESMQLNHVPYLGNMVFNASTKVDDVLALANGKSAVNVNKMREGVVFKRVNGQEHFKAVSPNYLLKKGE